MTNLFKLPTIMVNTSMVNTSPHHPATSHPTPRILPLENGDCLSRPEFERRYQAMPDVKAELIEGVVYMASPVRAKSHGQPHAAILAWLSDYWLATSGTDLNIEPTVRLDLDNEPQPDAVLRIEERAGGQSRIDEDDYIAGAPELIVEIAASSAAKDLHSKKQAYRRNGVQEYIVWQVLEQKLDWFWLDNGEYQSLMTDVDGVLCSRVMPGLWLAVTALLIGEMQQVIAVLREGLNSNQHQAFVQELAAHLRK
jgi:Uma2 family endonuclease